MSPTCETGMEATILFVQPAFILCSVDFAREVFIELFIVESVAGLLVPNTPSIPEEASRARTSQRGTSFGSTCSLPLLATRNIKLTTLNVGQNQGASAGLPCGCLPGAKSRG